MWHVRRMQLCLPEFHAKISKGNSGAVMSGAGHRSGTQICPIFVLVVADIIVSLCTAIYLA